MLKNEPYFLWLGSFYDVEQAAASVAMAPAAGRWQTSLLNALAECGAAIRVIGHTPEQMWPRGNKAFVKPSRGENPIPYLHTAYANLPFIRSRSLSRGYLGYAKQLVNRHGPPRAVLSYNISPWMQQTVQWLQNKFKIRWIPVVLDFATPPETTPQDAILHKGRLASGFVFLSHWAATLPLNMPSLHLDSGIDSIWDSGRPVHHEGDPTVLYTGMLIPHGGVDFLARAIVQRKDRPAQLVVTGRGPSRELQYMLKNDRRLRYEGLVPESRLRELIHSASVLVNPRPHDVRGNEWNFPSKLLHYLSTLRPVASTITPGVAPEYRDYVAVIEDTSPAKINAAIDQCLDRPEAEAIELADKTARFLAERKTWPRQAERLLAFVETVCSA
jgi:glycosyltransferase involved in cell wall biosynthesis